MTRKNTPSRYPRPKEERKLKRKMWFFLGLTVAVIIVGWLMILPYSLKQTETETSDKPSNSLADSASRILQILKKSWEETSSLLKKAGDDLKTQSPFINNNQSPESDDAKNANLSDEQRQELEQEIFPQFESDQ